MWSSWLLADVTVVWSRCTVVSPLSVCGLGPAAAVLLAAAVVDLSPAKVLLALQPAGRPRLTASHTRMHVLAITPSPTIAAAASADPCPASHRWCPTYPDYFAVSTSSPAKGAVVHVHNVTYTHAPPTAFQIAPRPLYVRSFDFVAARGIPRIVAAVGREVVVFYIGVDS